MKKLSWFLMICLVFCLCSCDMTGKTIFYSVVVIDDGDVIDSRAVEKESTYTLPKSKNEDGFKGWKIGNSSILVSSGNSVKITSDTTIIAVRDESSTFEYCSVVVLSKGDVIESKVVLNGSDYILPAAPDGTGFKGWSVENSPTLKESGTSIQITSDIKITAEWENVAESEYCSVVVLNKGELLESKILLVDSMYILPDAPDESGFKGWRVEDSELLAESGTSVKITSNITITAVWTETPVTEPTYYAVAVIDNDSIVDTVAVKAGENYVLPSVSSRQGYFFSGWKVGDNSYYVGAGETITVSCNTTIKAVWAAIYTLTVEVPQNVTNVNTIGVDVGKNITFESKYENYTSVKDGYYQYSFQLMNLSEGEYAVKVYAWSSGVTKTASLIIGEEADKTITIRLADKSEVIDLSAVSITPVLTTRVDSSYNLFGDIKINVPDNVYLFYTSDGSLADTNDTLYGGESITLKSGVMLSTCVATYGRFVTGSKYKWFMIELSSAIGAIGPAGGYVFYDKGKVSEGWRMLEAGRSKLSSLYQWGSYTTALSTYLDIGYGKSNTATLINAMNSDSSLSFPAAEAVWNVDVYKNGYTDWFLPSIFEMSEMYPVLKRFGLAGPLSQTGSCWTSTSIGNLDAMYSYMDNGSQNYLPRGCAMCVWPIREF